MRNIFLILIFFLFQHTTFADNSIVAFVDSGIITEQDVEDRFQFVVHSNSIDLSKENVPQLKSHILSLLINEMLLDQESKRFKLTSTEDEIKTAVSRIEENKNLPKGSLFEGKDDQYKKQMLSQISSSIIWEKFLFSVIAPQTDISESEVKEFVIINYKSINNLPKEEVDSIRNNLRFKKIEMQGQHYMQNLKKTKFIEVHGYKLA